MARRGGLGTNLDALIPTSLTVGDKEVAVQNLVEIKDISPNPRQPRTYFDPTALDELIASIKEIGILQPPVVRQTKPGKYELIMGERRFRAAKAAGLTSIPVIIRQTPDNELLREALIENIHRSQLNAIEEAAAYSQLLNDFNCTHDELAAKLGRSRPLISNTIIDVNYDKITGDIFIGTDLGVQSFRSVIIEGDEKYNDVYAFPNPVRSNFPGTVFVRGLIDNSVVKIVDQNGNLVWETKSQGGQIEWPVKTLSGNRVSSGVYIVYASSTDGEQKAVSKILVIN